MPRECCIFHQILLYFKKVMHVFIFTLHLHPPSEIAELLPREWCIFCRILLYLNKVMHVFILTLHLHPPSEIAGLLPRATFHHGLPRERFALQPLCASCFVLDTVVLCSAHLCSLCYAQSCTAWAFCWKDCAYV